MSASSLFSLGTKAMLASQAALATTSHNIANANVPGYSRQQAELATAVGQYSGNGYFGKGVDVTTVSRAHDAFLTREAASARSLAAMDAGRLELLRELEAVFPGGEQGVGHAAGALLNSMVDLSANPGDAATREVVLARALDVASRFAAAGQQLDVLQQQVREELQSGVAEVNRLAANIAELNQRISAAQGLGQPPNDLLDQRDQALSDLSQQLQISTVRADDGSVSVFVAGGQSLVLGAKAQTLKLQPDASDPSRLGVAMAASGVVLQASALGGGAIAGVLRFQNDDLVDGRTRLGQLAGALAGSVNRQQSLGLDLRSPPGSGAPIFADVVATQAVSSTSTATVAMSVVDATQLQASEYSLQFAAGAWKLTRLADGWSPTSFNSGDVVDGLKIDLGPPAPATSDKFLLQPLTHAAKGMRRVLDDINGIAAAAPLSASVGGANTGTASVAALRVVNPAANPASTATITFAGGGNYNWTLSGPPPAAGSGLWSAGTPITIPPNDFEFVLAGVPATGDVFSVGATLYPASNNGNALAYTALRDAALVAGSGSITDAYAAAMADIGVRVQGAASGATISAAVATQAETARSAASGVNLDEEAARLIHFQQSYQAAAKILQVAQTVFDTLLQAT